MENAVVYEITAKVEPQFIEQYEDYMRRRHIPDLLATGYFCAAQFERSYSGRYRIRYEARSQADLEKYLETEAVRLRADFTENFPAGVEVSRELWRVVQFWEKE
jgi:hypothetical protein